MRFLLTALALAAISSAAQAVVLVKDHQPQATIVVDKAASEQVQNAAKTLQEYIRKSTGATLPIGDQTGGAALHVGSTPYVAGQKLNVQTLDEDGFLLRTTDAKNFVIIGGSDWGTEFGVYDFLERYLGVRWLMPGEIGEDVPQHATLDIPTANVRQEPVYLSRMMSPVDKIETRSHQAPTRWARFNRARSRINFHHNLLHVFPVEKYGTTHPELYPLINGQRLIPKDWRWQPNLSAPAAVDIAVQEIEDYFAKNPNAKSFSLGSNDSNLWDESPASKARRSGKTNVLGLEDVSDDYFLWANAVVERVLQKYPDKWFGMLAYNGLYEPPTKVSVHPRIVPFITYERLRWSDPKAREAGHELTERWHKAAPTVGWYDYAYGLCYLLPRVWPHRMQQYLNWGAKHGVRHHYAELYPNWGEGAKPWVYTKLQWNPNQDVDALRNDWYAHCAGEKAAPELKSYYDIWEKFWSEDIFKSRWYRPSEQYLPFNAAPLYLLDVPESYVTRSDAHMNAALRLADTPQRKARVAKLAEMWEFYKLSILTYQAAYKRGAGGLTDPQNEAQALAFLDKTEQIAALSNRRQELLTAFKDDPLFSETAGWITQFPVLSGQDWQFSLMWRLMPWLDKSTPLKQRIQKIAAEGAPPLKEQAGLMLHLAAGTPVPIMENTSFEDTADVKKRWWSYWDKASESPDFHKGQFSVTQERAKTGQNSVLVEGLGYGALMTYKLTHPAAHAGTYFARISCYLPEDSRVGQVSLEMQGIGEDGKTVDKSFFSVPVALVPGEWTTATLPIVLPEDTRVTRLQLIVPIKGFDPDGKLYLDDAGIDEVR